jgi:hypothetical protein
MKTEDHKGDHTDAKGVEGGAWALAPDSLLSNSLAFLCFFFFFFSVKVQMITVAITVIITITTS